MEALEIIQNKLIGNFYSRFSMGYTIDLYFDSFWLIAHNVTSSDERELNDFLLSEYMPAKEAIDNEDVSKSVIICSTLQKNNRGQTPINSNWCKKRGPSPIIRRRCLQ